MNGNQKLCEACGLKRFIKTKTFNFQNEYVSTSKYKYTLGALVKKMKYVKMNRIIINLMIHL